MQDDNDEPGFIKPRSVYVTNWGYHDYKKAARYGELRAITKGKVDYRFTDRLRAGIISSLSEMLPDDIICISGSPVLSGEVFAIVIKKFGHVNYIYWEAFLSDYLPRTTDGTGGGGDVEPNWS